MDTQLTKKVAQFIEFAHASMEATNQELATRDQATADFKKNATAAAEDLVMNGIVDESQQVKLAEKLADPNYVLTQLLKLAKAQPKMGENAQRLGTPVDAPNAGNAKQASTRGAKTPTQRDIDFVTSIGLSPEYA